MWKYALNGLIVNVRLGSLEMWKSGNVEICVERFNRYLTKLGSLEIWKSGNLEMWKYALNGLIVNVLILVVWKSGNVEICVERFNS